MDTSALYAILDEEDANHRPAAEWLSGPGADDSAQLLTHNYVIVETAALVQRRLGSSATRALFHSLVPALSVAYVDQALHRQALSAYLAGNPAVSLVDRTSFETMRDLEIDQAFAFDADFQTSGFRTVP